MDAAVDAYFPILDQLDEFVDGLEQRVFANFDEGALRDIFAVKRLVLVAAPAPRAAARGVQRPHQPAEHAAPAGGRRSTSATCTTTCCASTTRSRPIANC